MSCPSTEPQPTAELPAQTTPRHIAIIQDGNGRWASQRGLSRTAGHRQGVLATRRTLIEAQRLGVQALTLYSFSVENWRRPKQEVDFLMALFAEMLEQELPELHERGVRVLHVGRRDNLPAHVLKVIDHALECTADNTELQLALAWNYGGRAEILDAARALARRCAAGTLEPEAIDEQIFSDHLYTAGMPDPDLLIRTAGEMRISNFLLWQVSYAELWVTPTLWPDFDETHLAAALESYTSRKRKFGGL